VSLPHRQVVGVEALARWQHPTRGLLAPAEFIPLAEASGLIEPLERNLLDAAVRQCRDWRDAGLTVAVAVNLSATTLQSPAIVDLVAATLDRHGVPGSSLTVELTERALLADPQRGIVTLRRLHDLGIRLALDDVGSAQSSLAHLTQLPVDDVKIDRPFMQALGSDERAGIVVASIVELAHRLGLHVVAEGIEDRSMWQQLVDLACDAAQGYYICRPLAAADLTYWLRQGDDRTLDLSDVA
jgi:EAL domain-containing protein (putative c-di-GMP-specific phosphodiesterase class I)